MYGLRTLAAALVSLSPLAVADPIIEARGSGAVTQTLAYIQPTVSCVAGAQIIVARASDEPQGLGVIGGVADSISKQIGSSNVVAVVYPATLDNYPTSEQEGVVGMKNIVTDYVNKCPGHWIILMGYSQGAQVVADTLVGSDEKGFSDDSTNPVGLGTNFLNQVAAIIMMGDPGNVPNAPGHVGNASKDGIFPRQNNDAFKQYNLVDKMQSYCDANDEFCSGGNSLAVHVGYAGEYGNDAVKFAVDKFSSANGGLVGGGSSSPTSAAGGSSKASSAAQTSAAQTSAASSPKTSAAGGSTKAASSASAKTTSAPMTNPASVQALLTSNRYFPTTTVHQGTYTELQNLVSPGAAAPGAGIDKGVAGAVFGGAMFVMGML